MPTSSSDMSVKSGPVARVHRGGLILARVPRITGAARGIFLFLLVAIVVGGAVWGYLGSRNTEPSADLSQPMEQATEAAAKATADAASEAAESVADAASEAASTAAENTQETIEAVGDEIQSQTDADAGLGGVGDLTESPSQAEENVSELPGAVTEPAPEVGASDVITESTSEPLSAAEPPTTAPRITSPTTPESTLSEPVTAPAPPTSETSESDRLPEPAAETGGSGDTAREAVAMTEPAAETAAAESTSPLGSSETITVKPGEYLYSIAKRIYGDASKWRLIFDANRDRLSNPDAVQVGMKLVVPATH